MSIEVRTNIQENTHSLAKGSYQVGPDNNIDVADGTHTYESKSGNFRFQRLSYSGQKLNVQRKNNFFGKNHIYSLT